MRGDLFTDLYQKEKSYWWHVCKRRIVFSLLRGSSRVGPAGGERLGLDIGCGAGYTAKLLDAEYRMVGIDFSRDALRFCKSRGLDRLCRVDIAHFSLPFKSDSFDFILALDVIEHLDHDRNALAECRRILKDGGLLIVTVPAFMTLWSPWDEALGHKRRYTARDLLAVAQETRFLVRKMSYFFFFIFPIAVVIRKLKRMIKRDAGSYPSDFISVPNILNTILVQLGLLEQWTITRFNASFPFGLSVISVMEKNSLQQLH